MHDRCRCRDPKHCATDLSDNRFCISTFGFTAYLGRLPVDIENIAKAAGEIVHHTASVSYESEDCSFQMVDCSGLCFPRTVKWPKQFHT
jgi:hypothetical protein